jgi:hypothetical protein
MKLLSIVRTLFVAALINTCYGLSEPFSTIHSLDYDTQDTNIITPDGGSTFYVHGKDSLFKIDIASNTSSIIANSTQRSSFTGNMTLSQNKKLIYGVEGSWFFAPYKVFRTTLDGSYKEELHTFQDNDRHIQPVGNLLVTKVQRQVYGIGRFFNGDPEGRGGILYNINFFSKYKALYNFPRGQLPYELVLSPDERYLYGLTAMHAGFGKCGGTLFRVSLEDTAQKNFETLRTFDGCSLSGFHSLVISKDGNSLYLVDRYFGNHRYSTGSIQKLALNEPDYPMTELYSAEGFFVEDIVLSSDDKTLYGVASGAYSKSSWFDGSIFKLSLDTAQPEFSKLYALDKTYRDNHMYSPRKIILDNGSLFGLVGDDLNRKNAIVKYSINSD